MIADYTFVNPDLGQLWQVTAQTNYLLCMAIGILLFIAFSSRFKT